MLDFVGLADRRDQAVTSLNLHEKRLLEIARQLAGRPRLVLLDEVMAGLNDTELAGSIEMVRRARSELGVTVIWVEHVMKAVMSLAERVVVLNFGRVIVDGTPDVAMRDPEVVEAYLGTHGGGDARGR
jgi:branched-chain amino acid transport system ATP-binding protein